MIVPGTDRRSFVYDLRFASDHFGGIGSHADALLRALLQQPGGEAWTVLWNPALPATRYDFSEIRTHPRVTWVERSWRPFSPVDLLRLGQWLNQTGAALYLSPFYLSPPFTRCPVVVTLHDVWPLRLSGLSWIGRLNYRVVLALLRNARLVLTSSTFSRDEIVKLVGLPAERVRVILLGCPPPPREAPRPPSPIPPRPFALVVGDNRPRKNLVVLADAWARLGATPPLTLAWAGRSDPRYPALDALAKRRDARGVVALGWVPEEQLAWLYGNTDMLLFPSVYEGFGLPILEAMTHGKPVIAADTPVFREVADEAALLLDPSDPDAWARAVLSLFHQPERATRLREAGLRRASELTYERTAARTLEVLRGIEKVDTNPR